MANKLQLFIYTLSAASPIAIVFAVVWYIQNKSITVSIVCVIVSLFFIAAFYFSFTYGKRKISMIKINVNEIKSADKWIVGYVILYISPCTNIVIEDYNQYMTLLIGFILIMVNLFVKSPFPNPLLIIQGYHFYSVGAENGVKEYLLISKQSIRNKKQIKYVKRLFEYLLLDDSGR